MRQALHSRSHRQQPKRALLQVLATLFAVEQRRTSDPRNVLEVRAPHVGLSFAPPVSHLLAKCQQAWLPTCAGCLQMLSSNTRRTKVVELSSGTHRSAACARLAVPPRTAASHQAHQGVELPLAGAQRCLPGTWGSPSSALQRGGAPAQKATLTPCCNAAAGS